MTNHTVNEVHYGHPGLPVYSSECRSWSFSSRLSAKQLATTVLRERHQPFDRSDSARARLAYRPSQVFRPAHDPDAVVQTLPSLASSASQLASLSLVSSAAASTADMHDAHVGDRLAVGTLNCRLGLNDLNSRLRATNMSVIAYSSGSNHEVVCLQEVADELHGWKKQSKARLGLPRPLEPIGRIFTGGAPVRQLHFPHSGRSMFTLLAVRLAGKTVLVDCQLRDEPVPCRSLDGGLHTSLPASTFDLKPAVTISAAQTGGSEHASFAFSRWKPSVFAIVDQDLSWHVFQVAHRLIGIKAIYKLVSLSSGSLYRTPGLGYSPANATREEDGWARVCWFGPSLVLVSSRSVAVLLDPNKPNRPAVELDLGLTSGSSCILELRQVKSTPELLVVLTSTHIHLGRVTTGDRTEYSTLRSWKHGRSITDLSHTISISDLDREIQVLLYSRLYGTATLHLFGPAADSPGDGQSRFRVSAPIYMKLCLSKSTIDYCPVPQTVLLAPCRWLNAAKVSVATLAKTDRGFLFMRDNVRFFSLFLSFPAAPTVLQTVSLAPPSVVTSFPEHRLRSKLPRMPTQADPLAVFLDQPVDVESPVRSSGTTASALPALLPYLFSRKVDMTRLFGLVQQKQDAKKTDVHTWQRNVQNSDLSGFLSDNGRFGTLHELAPAHIQPSDLDSEFPHMSSFVAAMSASGPGRPVGHHMLRLCVRADLGRSGLLGLYEHLCNVWVGQMAQDDSKILDRIARERHIRTLAITLFLASTVPSLFHDSLWASLKAESRDVSPANAGVVVRDLTGPPLSSQLGSLAPPTPSNSQRAIHGPVCLAAGRIGLLLEESADSVPPGRGHAGSGTNMAPNLGSNASTDDEYMSANSLPPSSQPSSQSRLRWRSSSSRTRGAIALSQSCPRDSGPCRLSAAMKASNAAVSAAIMDTWPVGPSGPSTDPAAAVQAAVATTWAVGMNLVRHRHIDPPKEDSSMIKRRQKKERRQQQKLARKLEIEARKQALRESSARQEPAQVAEPSQTAEFIDPFRSFSSSVLPSQDFSLYSSQTTRLESSQAVSVPSSSQLPLGSSQLPGLQSSGFPVSVAPSSGRPLKKRQKRKDGF